MKFRCISPFNNGLTKDEVYEGEYHTETIVLSKVSVFNPNLGCKQYHNISDFEEIVETKGTCMSEQWKHTYLRADSTVKVLIWKEEVAYSDELWINVYESGLLGDQVVHISSELVIINGL